MPPGTRPRGKLDPTGLLLLIRIYTRDGLRHNGDSSQQGAQQQRIIVRTVDITLVVSDLSSTSDTISSLAVQFGGWVVSSRRDQRHRSTISIRVPAESVDEALAQLKASAVKVESEISSSQDFTNEYVDTSSKIRNLRATEAQLLKLLERANDIEDALKVQAEVTKVQEQIERGQGRLNFLSETSAFSLININLKLGPRFMAVDAGADPTVREGEPVRFRASITPPPGITDFTFEWEFGDGSSPVSGQRTALTVDNPTRTTGTITHIYPDDRDSPFIVTLKVTGIGDDGVAEGEDTLIVTVTKVPDIEVFADQDPTVREGKPLELTGSFTRPADLTDFTYRWDFGDGSEPAAGSLPENVTNISSIHIYPDSRPFPFTATLTITANSEAGEITGSNSTQVAVVEGIPWLAGWDPTNSLKLAVLALSYIGRGAGTVAIWIGVFSPIWIIALVVIYILRRRQGSYLRKDRE